jgi:hypothetical protein
MTLQTVTLITAGVTPGGTMGKTYGGLYVA